MFARTDVTVLAHLTHNHRCPLSKEMCEREECRERTAATLRTCDVLIIDGMEWLPAHVREYVEVCAKMSRENGASVPGMGGLASVFFGDKNMPPRRAQEIPFTEDEWYQHAARFFLENRIGVSFDYARFLSDLSDGRISATNAEKLRAEALERKSVGADFLVLAPTDLRDIHTAACLAAIEGEEINLQPEEAPAEAPADPTQCTDWDGADDRVKVGARVQVVETLRGFPKYAYGIVDAVDEDRSEITVRTLEGNSTHRIVKTVCIIIKRSAEVCSFVSTTVGGLGHMYACLLAGVSHDLMINEFFGITGYIAVLSIDYRPQKHCSGGRAHQLLTSPLLACLNPQGPVYRQITRFPLRLGYALTPTQAAALGGCFPPLPLHIMLPGQESTTAGVAQFAMAAFSFRRDWDANGTEKPLTWSFTRKPASNQGSGAVAKALGLALY